MKCLILMAAAVLALPACGAERVAEEKASSDSQTLDESKAPTMQAPAVERVSVIVGADGPGFDACAALGQIVSGGEMVAVRAAPRDDAEEVAALEPGAQVMLCDGDDGARGAEWFGIVFSTDSETGDCGVTSPVPSERAYAGPCSSGWVSVEAIEALAG